MGGWGDQEIRRSGDQDIRRSGYQDIRGIGYWELSLNAEFGVRNAEF